MKIITLFLLFLVAPFFLIAQNKTQTSIKSNSNSEQFERKTISFMGFKNGKEINGKVLAKLKNIPVSREYNSLQIEDNLIESGNSELNFFELKDNEIDEQIKNLLNENKVGHQILANWFNRQPDSSFNLEVLQQRGYKNANEKELLKMAGSKRSQTKLLNTGLKMVNQNYVLIFDFKELQTMKEYYNSQEIEEKYQYLNGFISNVHCYLVKFDFNGSIATSFFRDYWIAENDSTRNEKIKIFENSEFPFIPIKKYQFEITSTQHNEEHPLAPDKQKTPDELKQDLVNLAFENILADQNEQKEPFVLKTKVVGVDPISVKLGNKGGLKFDQRYFVYENRIKKTGKVYKKRVGVIKSSKITDTKNENLNQTDNSAFYQIAGELVNEGMYLKKSNDVGLNLFFGKSVSGLPGYNGRIEYYFSKMFGDLITPGKMALGATSVKIYLAGGYNQKSYSIGEVYKNHTFKRGSIGVSKDFYPLRFIHFGPFLGYGLETVNWQGSEEMVSSNFVEMGLKLGVNVSYNIQLIASYNYYHFINSILLDGERDVIDENFPYKNKFKDRANSGFSLGVRIML